MFFIGRPSRQSRVVGDGEPQPTVARDLPTVTAEAGDRAVFPYSIIEGGARNADELKGAIALDPVVAAHYTDFDLKNTKVVRLEQPKIAHVSYRMGNAVYWTRKPLVIGAGETVLTDGVHVARTRCGNQLADEPGETSPAEPAAALLDTPVTATPARATTPSLLSGPQPVAVLSNISSGAPSGGIGSSGTHNPGMTPSAAPMTAAGAVGSGMQSEDPATSDPSNSGSDLSGSSSNPSGSNPGSPAGLPPSGLPAPQSDPFPGLPGGWDVPSQVPLIDVDLPDSSDPGGPLDPPQSPLVDPPQPPNVPEGTTTPGDGEAATIPEPGTTILMLGGALAYAARRMRRKP